MASRTGQLLVVDTIFAMVAHSLPSALSALQRSHDAIASKRHWRGVVAV